MALVGLKDIHASIINENGTYSTPKKLAPAIMASLNVNTVRSVLHGDDAIQEVVENFVDGDIELNITDLSTEDYAFLLGKEVNEDGVVEDNADTDVAPYVAIGFKSEKSNGAYRYVWLYKAKFSNPNESYNTKGESVDFQTSTISGKFMARDTDKKWRARVDSDDTGVNATVIANWFNTVYTK